MEQENVFSDVDSEIESDAGSKIENNSDSELDSGLESDIGSDIDNELESESENIDYKTIDKPNASNSGAKYTSDTKNTNKKSNSHVKTKRSVRFSKKIEFDDKPLNKLSNKSIVSVIAYKSNLRKNKTDDVLFSKSIVTPVSKSINAFDKKRIVADKNIAVVSEQAQKTVVSEQAQKTVVSEQAQKTVVSEQAKKTNLLTIKQQFEKMIMQYPTLAEMITIQEIIAELEVYQEQHRKFRASLAVIIDWLKTPNMINLCKAKAKISALHMIYDDGTKFLQHINDKFDEINIDI